MPDGVRWLALEVEGLGPIAHQIVFRGAPTTISNGATVRCNDTGQLLPVPVDGDLTARVVLHGDGGAAWAGPWTTMGPAGPPEVGGAWNIPTGPAPWSPPSGVAARLDGLSTWSPVDITPDARPLAPDPGGCGALELVTARATEVPAERAVVVDDLGALRRLDWTDGTLRVDGVAVPGVREPARHVISRGGSMWVGLDGAVLAVRDGAVVGRHLLGDAWVEAMALDANGSVVVRTRNPRNGRTEQALTPALALVDERPVRHPIEVDRVGSLVDRLWRVNGLPLALDGNVSDFRVGPEHALFVTWDQDASGQRIERLHLLGSDGSEVWTQELPPDHSVGETAIDDRGVGVRVRQGAQRGATTAALGWHVDGSPRADWPTPSRTEVAKRTSWGARELVTTADGLSVEEGGVRTARVQLPRGAVVGRTEETVELATVQHRGGGTLLGGPTWRDRDAGPWVLVEQTLRCTGVAGGVPERYPRPQGLGTEARRDASR